MYIGRNIDSINNISTLDNLSFNGSLQTFNLTQNSVAFVPVSADALQIQIDGVIQSGNYTVSGSTVTFDFTPSGSSVCNGIRHYGVGIITSVSDGAVTEAKIGSGAVTNSKLGNNSVGITQLNVSDGSNGQALTTNGSGTLAFADAGLSGWSSSSGNLLPSDASKGIYLGVNSATSSNLLDDYEEGTWTATMIVDGGAMSLESAFNTGSYVKIGNIVNVQGFFKVDSTNASGGYVNVNGLPFACASLSEGAESSVGSVLVRSTSSAVGGGIVGWIEGAGTTQFAMRENGTTGVGNTLTGHFDSGTDFTINVTYRTV